MTRLFARSDDVEWFPKAEKSCEEGETVGQLLERVASRYRNDLAATSQLPSPSDPSDHYFYENTSWVFQPFSSGSKPRLALPPP